MVLAAGGAAWAQSAGGSATEERSGFYRYLGRTASGESMPFIGMSAGEAGQSVPFIGRSAGSGEAGAAGTVGSGSSAPPAEPAAALSPKAMAKAAVAAAAPTQIAQ